MEWKPARKSDMKQVEEYLRPIEYRAVALSARLLDKSGKGPTQAGNQLFLAPRDSESTLEGLLLLSAGGTVAPVFSEEVRSRQGWLKDVSSIINKAKRIHSIIGLEKDISPLIPLLNQSYRQVQYYIMKGEDHDLKNYIPPIVPDINIRKAEVKDAKKFFPLRREYELEEVLLDPANFQANSSFLHFKKILRSQLFYLAERDGMPLGTAGTNGWGLKYTQIGGVFTLSKERGRGIAGALMAVLSEELRNRGRKLCLFVKKENLPALELYRKMGFKTKGDFSIFYSLP